MSVSCSLEFPDYTEFQDFCNDGVNQLGTLDIFTDLDKFDYVGTFGNPNVNYIQVSY